jgi:hypothetical protein
VRHVEAFVPIRPAILLAFALTTLAGAAAAPAGAAWSAPREIVSETLAGRVAAAGNRHGSQAFAWAVTTKRRVLAGRLTGPGGVVRARVRLPDGRLGRTQTISSATGLVSGPQVGVDDLGNVTAVWVQAGRHVTVMAAYRPHGRRFGAAVALGRSGHFNDARPALAVGPAGDAVVAWNAGRSVRVVRRGVGPCRCFGAPVALRAGADQTVAIGPLGSAYVVWAAEVRSAAAEVHTRLRLATFARSGRRLGREHALSTTGDAGQPSLAIGGDGIAAVAWRTSLPAGGEQDETAPIMAASSSPDALVAPAQALSLARGDHPQLRLDAAGEAIVAWTELDPAPAAGDRRQVAFCLRPAGAAAFGSPSVISPPNVEAAEPSLAVDGAGNTHLLYAADGNVAVTQVRPPGAIFGAPATLPAAFAGGSLLAAGPKLTAVSGRGGRTLVSDWTP